MIQTKCLNSMIFHDSYNFLQSLRWWSEVVTMKNFTMKITDVNSTWSVVLREIDADPTNSVNIRIVENELATSTGKWCVSSSGCIFYAPPPESGGILCYTLRNFECLSVRPSAPTTILVSATPPTVLGQSF